MTVERKSVTVKCKGYVQLSTYVQRLHDYNILGYEYRWVNLQNLVIFYFDRPEDATMFSLIVL